MTVAKLMDLKPIMQKEVADLHHNNFLGICIALLEPNATYVYYNEDILIGYAEIGHPHYAVMAKHFLKKEYSEFMSEDEINICHGLYLKYIGINPLFKRKGYGTCILNESIKRARSDQGNFNISPSVTTIVDGAIPTALDAIYFFRKNEFNIISEYRVNDSIDTYFQKKFSFDNESQYPL